VMRTDVPVATDGRSPEAIARATACSESRFVYLVDAQRRLEGWFDCRAVDSEGSADTAVTTVDWREVSVHPDATLKEALSRMLGLGFRSISVVDETGVLLGVVGLDDIEETMTDSDAYIAPASAGSNEAGEAQG